MTAVQVSTADVGAPRPHRSWRILRLGVLNERAYRVRLVVAPVTLAVQLYLYDRLWTAVFSHTTVAAGLTLRQTLTYSLMALLIARVRWNSRTFNVRDSLERRGARRHCCVLVPAADLAIEVLHVAAVWRHDVRRILGPSSDTSSYCASHIIAPPRGLSGATVFAASLLLGQMVLYYLGQIVDIAHVLAREQ